MVFQPVFGAIRRAPEAGASGALSHKKRFILKRFVPGGEEQGACPHMCIFQRLAAFCIELLQAVNPRNRGGIWRWAGVLRWLPYRIAMSAVTSLLFVYGTLRAKAHHPMGDWLKRRAAFCGRGWFRGRLYDLGRYPGAVASVRAGERIVGELYRLRRAADLKILDRYEGTAYRRERVVVTAAGRACVCWIYLYARAVVRRGLIPSGDWLERT